MKEGGSRRQEEGNTKDAVQQHVDIQRTGRCDDAHQLRAEYCPGNTPEGKMEHQTEIRVSVSLVLKSPDRFGNRGKRQIGTNSRHWTHTKQQD